MEERLGFVAHSLAYLVDAIQGFLNGDACEGLYRGQVKSTTAVSTSTAADVETASGIEAWLSNGEYGKLLNRWVRGLDVDWTRLYGTGQPHRISLPTYPFARERYWISAAAPQTADKTSNPDSIRPEPSRDQEVLRDEAAEHSVAEPAAEHPIGTIQLVPVWSPHTKAHLDQSWIARFPSESDRVAIVGAVEANRDELARAIPHAYFLDLQPDDCNDDIAGKLSAVGGIDHLVWIAPHEPLASLAEDHIIADQERGVILAFRAVKALLALGYGSRNLGWTVITVKTQPINSHDPVNPTHASLHGLVGSMAKEYANWKVRLIDVEHPADLAWDRLFTLPIDPQGDAWVCRDNQWYRQQLFPLDDLPEEQTLNGDKIYRPDGVYVVIGGAGAIGEVWSEYMIRTWRAQIIWIGRRPKDDVIQAKVDRLAELGPMPLYIAADATDREALAHAYQAITQRFAQVHGVVHAAVEFSGGGLGSIEEERFRAVLASKVAVSVRLAQVFGAEPLDFVLFFSSINAFLKSPGSSGYASGCTFADAFAHTFVQAWPAAVKVINWGYWGSIGKAATSESFLDGAIRPGFHRACRSHGGIGEVLR
jgi:acyl transferase domain-containing protein